MSSAESAAGWAASKVYRIEEDRSRVIPRDVRRMLDLYGVTGSEQTVLVELAKEAMKKGWWHQYSGAVPEWFQFYLQAESDASVIRAYQPELVLGLLQTEGYMRAIAATAPGTTDSVSSERILQIRQERQRRLTEGDSPVELWIVLNEAVIRRVVGGPDLWREQLDHLAVVAQQRNITLQILPFARGEHPAMLGAFQITEFGSDEDPPMVYLEHQTGGLYVEAAEDVRRYSLMYNHLSVKALSVEESIAMLRQAAEDLS